MRGVKLLLVLPFLLSVVSAPAFLFAAQQNEGITVTAVKVIPPEEYGKPRAELEFNNAVRVREIDIVGAGERTDLRFPVYISSRKKVFPQVRLLTRQSVEAARTAVITRKAGAAPQGTLRYAIVSLTPFRRKSSLKALATVRFNDAIDIECKVIDGKNGIWVAWPSRKPKGGGQWIKQVIITDETLRDALEKELLERYRRMRAEEGAADSTEE